MLRKREFVSHTSDNRLDNGLTGQRPPALAVFEVLDFESPNKLFHFMVQGVDGLVFDGVKSVVVNKRGRKCHGCRRFMSEDNQDQGAHQKYA